jgi:C1A family cysteine protease
MVQAGWVFIPVSRRIIHEQYWRRRLRYLRDLAIVDRFISEHPDAAGIAQLVEETPSPEQATPTSGGNYIIQVPGAQGGASTVQTMGQAVKLQNLAGSILAASDPAAQRRLYQALYSGYTSLYETLCVPSAAAQNTCPGITPPAGLPKPSTLADARLRELTEALDTISSQGPALYSIVHGPPSPLPQGPTCTADEGGNPSLSQVYYGDQTGNTCTTGNPSGILANFGWPSEDQLTCVKSQGNRGTCHIFGSTSAFEQLVARDTGVFANLDEEDFEEHANLLWSPSYYSDGGVVIDDVNNAQSNGYQFPYENQWDYNPAYNQPATGFEYVNTCEDYPALEPGCSDSAPEAPQYCVRYHGAPIACYFSLAVLSGSPSPYLSQGGSSILEPAHPLMTVKLIQLALAENNAVVLGFQLTNAFVDSTSGYVPYHIPDLATTQGGHAVHLVGYISNEQLAGNPATASVRPGAGGGYFVIKNSWSTCAGDLGFYYVPVKYLTARATDITLITSVGH